MPQVEKYGVPVHVIGNWSRFSCGLGVESLELLIHNSQLPTHNSQLIIYPAAFAKGKNQKLLIAAFALVAAEFPGWKLRLWGRAEGRYAGKCRRLAAKTGIADKVDFAGFCDDLAQEYAHCGFVAFPSLDEGFGLVIADAAAFGKPAVMVHDWIGTASAGGGVAAGATPEVYAEALRRMMRCSELRKDMGLKAKLFCAEKYSRKAILDEWENLLAGAPQFTRNKNKFMV